MKVKNIHFAALLISMFVINAGLSSALIAVRLNEAEDEVVTQEFISEELLNNRFHKQLKQNGFTYQEAQLISLEKTTDGAYTISISEINDGAVAIDLREKIDRIKGILNNLFDSQGEKDAIDYQAIDNEITTTKSQISDLIGSDLPVEFQLLHFSDIDGGRDILTNIRNFSGLVNKFRGEYLNTLLLSSGDNWITGPEYTIASEATSTITDILKSPNDGRGHIKFLNELGVQASAFGNHEFDKGPNKVAEIISSDEQGWEGAKFPYVTTNLDFSGNAELNKLIAPDGQDSDTLDNKVTSYTVIEENNYRYGVIGAVSNALDVITNLDDVIVTTSSLNDLAADIQKDVQALKREGINKIILLAHMQSISIERSLAPLLNGVDIIVGGGSNTIFADDTDSLRTGDTKGGDYPEIYHGTDGNPIILVNTEGDFTYLGRLVVTFNENGIIDTNSIDKNTSGAYRTDFDINNPTENVAGVTMNDIDPEIVNLADALKQPLLEKRRNIIGYTTVFLNGDREYVRIQETNFGDLTADANMWYARKVDPEVVLSFKNGGGIRGSIGNCIYPPGSTSADSAVCGPPLADQVNGISENTISQLDIESSLKFDNHLVIATVKPTDIKDLLENGLRRAKDQNGNRQQTGSFPQVAGMIVEYDLANSAGSRVQKVTIKDANVNTEGDQPLLIISDGNVVDSEKDKQFKMATISYPVRNSRFPKLSFLIQDPNAPDDANALILNPAVSNLLTANSVFRTGAEQAALAEYLQEKHGTLAQAYTETDDRFDSTHTDTRLVDKTVENPVKTREVVGYTDVFLNYDDRYTRETNLGNLLADAFVAYANADDARITIAVLNSGGISANIGTCPAANAPCEKPGPDPNEPDSVAGEITVTDLENVLTYSNTVVTVQLTPQQLLEFLLSNLSDKFRNNPAIQVAGIRIEYDFSLDDISQRIRKITVLDSDSTTDGKQALVIVENGSVVDAEKNKRFGVAMTNYQAEQDSWKIKDFVANDPGGVEKKELPKKDVDLVKEYIRNNYGSVNNPYQVVDNKVDEYVPERLIILAKKQ